MKSVEMNEPDMTPWYKNPWIIGSIVVLILVIIALIYYMRKRKTEFFD